MSEDATPPPASCVHNLHRHPDGVGVGTDAATPEATTLCRNAVGVFQMLDCPLFLGRPCTYYEETPAPHPVSSDAELELAGDELRRDFLTWRYTKRVRALAHERGWFPEPRSVDPIAEPDEAEADLALRAAEEEEEEEEELAPEPVPAPRKPELYPGQRRSEERAKRRREGLKPRAGEGAEGEEGAGGEEPTESQRPRTVEELLEEMPEAPLPEVVPPRKRGARRGRGRRRSGGRSGRSQGGGGDPQRTAEAGQGSGTAESQKPRRRRRRRGARPPGGTPNEQRSQSPRSGTSEGSASGSASGSAPREGGRRRRRRRPRREGGSPPSGNPA